MLIKICKPLYNKIIIFCLYIFACKINWRLQWQFLQAVIQSNHYHYKNAGVVLIKHVDNGYYESDKDKDISETNVTPNGL